MILSSIIFVVGKQGGHDGSKGEAPPVAKRSIVKNFGKNLNDDNVNDYTEQESQKSE